MRAHMNTTRREYIVDPDSTHFLEGEYCSIPCMFDVSFLPQGYSEETMARVFYYLNRCMDDEGWTTGYTEDTDLRITPKPGAQAFNVDFLNRDGTTKESLYSDYQMLVTLLAELMSKVEFSNAKMPDTTC